MDTKDLKCLLLIITIIIAACIETDIYLPAFPDMMAYFQVTEDQIQSLLTWNFIGMCLSGPLYGPVSDSFGRKKPLLFALGLFLIGSLITVFSHGFGPMLWGRLLQGVGGGGCFTLGTAIIFDAFQKEKAVKAITNINIIVPFIIAAAPMLGGVLNHYYGFRSNFLTIAVIVLASLTITLFFFEETLDVSKRAPLQGKKILADFKRAFTSAAFWQVTVVVSLVFAGYLAFLSGASVLFVMEFGIAKQSLPYFQAAILGAWLVGSLTCSRGISRLGMQAVKIWGIALTVAGGMSFLLLSLAFPQNPYLMTGGMMIYTFGVNWMQGLYFPEGMEILPEIKGVTASLLTSTRLFLTASIVGLASYFYDATIYPIAVVIGGVIVIIVPTLILYEKRAKLRLTQ